MPTNMSRYWLHRSAHAVFVSIIMTSLTVFANDTGRIENQDTRHDEGGWYEAIELGGSLTTYSFGQSPYNHAASFLSLDDRRVFSDGALAFRIDFPLTWQPAGTPSLSVTSDYNATSCETCHVRDGRGISHAGEFHKTGFSAKPNLTTNAATASRHLMPGSLSQELQNVSWVSRKHYTLSDGLIVTLVAPVTTVDGKPLPIDLRNAPGVYGLGLLEAVPDSGIKQQTESQQFLLYGIKGIVSVACRTAEITPCRTLGRFGWKSSVSSLREQTIEALTTEIGIPHPEARATTTTARAEYGDLVNALSTYIGMLAVPARRIDDFAENERGARVFEQVGCAMCHRPSWTTGADDSVNPRVRNQKIFPFTDLLLHDMGDGLADPAGSDLSKYWRTPALWGIGMQATVTTGAGFLHDGRARSLLEAILWHGGEGTHSIRQFLLLTNEERDQLLSFVSSL